jgi:CRISPR-associated endonuclease/helicase Cas3
MIELSSKGAGVDEAWAKLNEDGAALPLGDHCGDVAAVLQELFSEPVWVRRLHYCAGRPLSDQDLTRLLVLAFLHDLGKANRGFWERQFTGKPIIGHTNETAALFYARCIAKEAAASRLLELIEGWGALNLFSAAMAHHGRPLEAYAGGGEASDFGRAVQDRLQVNKYPAGYWLPGSGYDPLEQLTRLLDTAEARFPSAFADGPALPDAAPFVSLFCGLLTLADWLGSDTSLFPVSGPHGPARNAVRLEAVARAVAGRGLASLATPPCSFASTFDVAAPRGIQHTADHPGLGPVALMEAETGSGKTEAALWRWLALRRAGDVDGLYFALPTRSAAVQLHARVQAMLDRVFGLGAIEAVLAVPGYIRAGDAEGQALPNFGVIWSSAGVGDGRWAAERPKRFLAARVAVGTIDQVLMAGLQVRHAHLRAAALSRSLLVVDEVHASDAFMGEVLAQVLSNHIAFGGRALLLSATLTTESRARLLKRPGVLSLAEACVVPYPALSGSARDPARGEIVKSVAKCVVLEAWPSMDDAASIAARAVEAARAGASVLIIRNSVAGAVAVARAVEAAAPDLAFRVDGVPTLHHGRFAPGDRRLLDAAVEVAFGKGRDARGRILCGSQTLEQSLDLDGDFLITDLAPMDVLLQRIGRLHRHRREDRGAFRDARAVVLIPAERDLSAFLRRVRNRHGLGPIRDGTGVYPDLLVLEATLRLIEANPAVTIPTDNRRLVEGALHPEVTDALKRELGTAWINHANAQDGTAMAERGLARRWALNLSASFDTLLFPDKDEAITTRLGTRDRLVDFEPSFAGPFGQAVERITVPGWMAGDIPIENEPVLVATDAEGTRFRLGERVFHYGRWGLDNSKTKS